jgi:hypothetical protein
MSSAGAKVLAEPPFVEAAGAAVGELQRECVALLSEVRGGVHRAVDLERRLKLDKTLAWHVFRLASAPEPLSVASSIPGARSMRRFLTAAANAKVNKSAISAVTEAFDRFERFVGEHAGGRAEFIAAAQGLGNGADARAELNVRKSLFRGNAQFWGSQAAMLVRSVIFHPSLSGPADTWDSLLVRGEVGLQRLRPGAPLTVRAFLNLKNEPASAAQNRRGVPPPESRSTHDLEVLREFSTNPLPEMVPTRNADGSFETELKFPPSGRKGAITVYCAQHTIGACSGEQSQNSSDCVIRQPAEALVSELLVPAGWGDATTARAVVYGCPGSVERIMELRPADLLPQRETVVRMAALEVSPAIAGSPGHSEAVASVLRRAGWLGTKFDVYRCTVEYPVLQTLISLQVDGSSARR